MQRGFESAAMHEPSVQSANSLDGGIHNGSAAFQQFPKSAFRLPCWRFKYYRSRIPQRDEKLLMNASPAASESQEIELTILMPCLNEAETLRACIDKAMNFLRDSGVSGEVIVADNGSTDDSHAITRSCGARLVEVPERGYGAALYYGTLAARGRFVIMGDSDDSYDFSRLMPFLEKLREGYGLVMGNRFKGGIKPGAMPWKNRWFGNPVMSAIGRFLFGSPIGDFWCGLRGFSREAFQKLDLRTSGMEYALEMVIKATLYGLKITEVPTTLSPDGRSRPPHLRPWRDGWRGLRFMLLFSPRWLFLYPGVLLIVSGMCTVAWLAPGPQKIGNVVFDYHSFLYAVMGVLVGFQAVLFSFFARLFVTREGLLPSDPRLESALKYISLELGLLVGGTLVLGGIAASAVAVWLWSQQSFGPLNPSLTLRIAIPAAFSITLGSEIVLASFFLGVLGLNTRRSQLR